MRRVHSVLFLFASVIKKKKKKKITSHITRGYKEKPEYGGKMVGVFLNDSFHTRRQWKLCLRSPGK